MKFTDQEIQQTYNELRQKVNPWGAFVGALIGSVPAIAMYAFFIHMGAILYVFILIPPSFIGLASQFTGRVYLVKHRIPVGIVACLVHTACVYYFNYKVGYYFIFPIIFAMAVITSKRSLDRLQGLVVDMEEEGRFKEL